MILEPNDELLDFIPATVAPYDRFARDVDRVLFPQSVAEKRDALNFKSRSEFDGKTETLVIHFLTTHFKSV